MLDGSVINDMEYAGCGKKCEGSFEHTRYISLIELDCWH